MSTTKRRILIQLHQIFKPHHIFLHLYDVGLEPPVLSIKQLKLFIELVPLFRQRGDHFLESAIFLPKGLGLLVEGVGVLFFCILIVF